MTIYPHARYRPVSGLDKDKVIIPVGIILHVRDGLGKSLFDYFNGESGGIESHWYIDFKGNVEQYRDTLREADANYHANSFLHDGKWYGYHSVETEGLEHGEWTIAQLIALKQLIRWDAAEHNFPLRVCVNPFASGVGYHTMWGSPSQWTPRRKTCPGPDRIKQFKNILVPWMNATANSTVEDDVDLDDKIEVYNPQDGSRPTITVKEALRRASYVYNYMKVADQREAARFAEVKAQNAAVLTALQGINNGVDPAKIGNQIAEAIKGLRITLGVVDDDEESAEPTFTPLDAQNSA